MKRIIVILLIIISGSRLVSANLEINEVMYDLKTGSDTGREWIEVYNNSNEDIDIGSLTLFEANTNHKLKIIEGDTKIGQYGYAVIVEDSNKFKQDWPDYVGAIVDSSFSLNNSGEGIALKKGDEIMDQFNYKSSLGAAGDGKSLQKINGEWLAEPPTPGEKNKIAIITKKTEVVTTKSTKNPYEIRTKTELSNTTNSSQIEPTNQEKEQNGLKINYFLVTTLIVLIGVGIGAVYFIRIKKGPEKDGQDFELLDE